MRWVRLFLYTVWRTPRNMPWRKRLSMAWRWTVFLRRIANVQDLMAKPRILVNDPEMARVIRRNRGKED